MKEYLHQFFRRLDPTLCLEDNNAIYQAFKERRNYRSRKRFALPEGWLNSASRSSFLLIAVIIVSMTLTFYNPIFCCFTILFISLLPAVYAYTGKSRVYRKILPLHVQRIFGNKGYYPQIATELWLTGAGGRKILEAIYLEIRTRSKFQQLTFPLSFLMILILIYANIPASPTVAKIPSILVYITIGYLCYELYLFLFQVLGFYHARTSLHFHLLRWRGEMSVFQSYLPLLVYGLVYGICIIVYLLLARTFFHAIQIVYISFFAEEKYVGSLPPIWESWSLLGFAILSGLSLRAIRAVIRPEMMSQLDFLLDEADYSYEIFMRKILMEDSDYRRNYMVHHPPPPKAGTQLSR